MSVNLYPTDDDLFVFQQSTLPVINYKRESTKPIPNFEQSISVSPDLINFDLYEDDQIIPWRKLYSQKRKEDNTLHSLITSPILQFLFKYNQWPVIIISTIVISGFAIILDWSSTWLDNIKYGYCKSNFLNVRESCNAGNWITFAEKLPSVISSFLNLLILLMFGVGFALLGFTNSKNEPWISKSGISELKLIISGYVNNQFLKPSIIIKKFISLMFICASGGLLVGYEGPLIHISCGVINFIIDVFSSKFLIFQNLRNEATRREMISIGFVIGISLAFGAPIGGLLFSVENLKFGSKINSLIWNGFVCSSLGTFIFFKFHPFKKISINEAFTVDIANGWIFFETFPYLFVGLVCGLLSLCYNKFHLKLIKLKSICRTSENLPSILHYILANPILEITILVLVTHILLYPLNFSYLTLNDTLKTLFYDCSDLDQPDYDQSICKLSHKWIELVYYSVILFFQSNYSYTLDIPGGILLPSLTIGALIGRIIGGLVQMIQTHSRSNLFLQCYEENKRCVSPGSYAIVGAASFFAGVTNTSVAAVVIVFEITGAVTYLIPLMLGVVVSKSIVDIFDSQGFYELWLDKFNKNYLNSDLSDSYRLAQFSEVELSDIIDNYKSNIIYLDDTLLTVEQLVGKIDLIYEEGANFMDDISNNGLVILKNKFRPVLVGWINLNELYKILQSTDSKLLVSFNTTDDELNNNNILKLEPFVIPDSELFKVNGQFSLLSAYQLMDRMLITNLFVYEEGKFGDEFKGVLRMSDLSKLVKT